MWEIFEVVLLFIAVFSGVFVIWVVLVRVVEDLKGVAPWPFLCWFLQVVEKIPNLDKFFSRELMLILLPLMFYSVLKVSVLLRQLIFCFRGAKSLIHFSCVYLSVFECMCVYLSVFECM